MLLGLLLGCSLWSNPQQLGLWGNGCSFSPDIGGQACWEHDFSYTNGGTEEDRAIADHELALALYSHGFSTEVVERYFRAVRRFGGSHWNYRDRQTRTLPPDYPHYCKEWK